MKKAIVLLLTLLVVGALAFADDAAPAKDQPAYTLSASVTGKWQYDLDTSKSGFTNDWDISFHYYLINDMTKSAKGEGDNYGEITITHLNLAIIDRDEGNIGNDADIVWGLGADGDGDNFGAAAKLHLGSAWIGLGHGAYTADYENAVFVPLFSSDAGYDNSSAFNPEMSPAGSIQLGYDLGDMGTVSAVVGSLLAGANNEFSEYTVGFDASLTPVKDLLAVKAGFWYNLDSSDWVATAKATVTSGDLSANAALDATSNEALSSITASTAGDTAFDMSADVTYKLFEGKDSVVFDVYYTESKDAATVDPPKYHNHKGDIGLKFVDAGGLVEPVAFTVGVFADNLAGDDGSLLSVAVSASYKAALSDTTYAKPYIDIRKDLSDEAAAFADGQLYVKAGVEAVLFSKATLDGNFTLNTYANDLNHVLAKDVDNVLTLSAKVAL